MQAYIQALKDLFIFLFRQIKSKIFPRREGVTERRMLELLTDRVSFSDYLTWLSCDEFDEYCLFETSEGIGICFEVYIPSYLGDNNEATFKQIFSFSYPKDTIINMFAYASSNIKPYIDIYRNAHTFMPNVDHPEILQEMIRKRADFYEKAADEGFWPGAKYKPRIFKNMISFLVPYSTYDGNVKETYDMARTTATKLRGLLASIRLSPVKVDASHLKTLMKELFNVDFKGIGVAKDNVQLRRQIIDKNTRFNIVTDKSGNSDLKVTQNGKEKFIRTYSITGYPKQIGLWEWNNLIFKWDSRELVPPLPSPFGFALSVKYVDWQKSKTRLQGKAAWNINNAKDNPLSEYVTKITKRAEEGKYVNELLDSGAIPLPSVFSIFMVESSQADLDFVSYDVINRLSSRDFDVYREIDKGMLSTFFEMLPMNHISERDVFLNRRMTMFDANLSCLVPFISGVCGCSSPAELKLDRKGQLMFWDRFISNTNFNMVVVAESGGGKSYSRGDSHVQSLTMGRRIRVLDIGRSYEPLCHDIGGEFVEITRERMPCFNFFTNMLIDDKTGGIHEDEMDSIVPLVGFLCGYDLSKQIADAGEENLSARVASMIIEALDRAWRQKGQSAGLEEVANEFLVMSDESGIDNKLARDLLSAIKPYSHGIYAHYFNGENNIQYSKDYVVLELEEVEQKDPRLQAAIIFSIIVKILREVFIDYSKHGKRTEVDVDEAWAIFNKVSAKEAFNSFVRRFRKYDASLAVATQGIADLYASPTTEAIWNNSAHKLYLQMNAEAIEKARDEKRLVMGEFELEWFKTLSTQKGRFSEMYFDSPAANGIVRLLTDRYSYGLLTTTGREKRAIREFAAKNNTDVGGALKMLTEQKPLGEVLVTLGVPAVSVGLALQYQSMSDIDMLIGQILIMMGVIDEEMLNRALKVQQEQVKWEKIFAA